MSFKVGDRVRFTSARKAELGPVFAGYTDGIITKSDEPDWFWVNFEGIGTASEWMTDSLELATSAVVEVVKTIRVLGHHDLTLEEARELFRELELVV